MRMARKMGGHREPVADAVPARLGEYHVVLGSLSLHIVPKKTRHAALAFAVDGVGDAEPLFVKPKRPFFRVIVDADAPVRSCQEVDMMAEREPGAAHSRACFLQEIRDRKSTRLNSSH